MASPQTRNLKTANGGKVAPQHYNDAMGDFEYSKGSDGALHTKVINQPSVTLVDKNGNPIDSENKLPVDVAFPTEQAVKDADVLAKLADIETKIQATNDRLNQTLNTQLTGSCVEEITVLNNVTVLVGSQYANDGYPYLDKYIKARALIWSNQPYSLNFFQTDKNGTPESTPTKLTQDNTPAPTRFHTYDLSSKMPTVRGHFLYINNGTADATLTIKIHGQKW